MKLQPETQLFWMAVIAGVGFLAALWPFIGGWDSVFIAFVLTIALIRGAGRDRPWITRLVHLITADYKLAEIRGASSGDAVRHSSAAAGKLTVAQPRQLNHDTPSKAVSADSMPIDNSAGVTTPSLHTRSVSKATSEPRSFEDELSRRAGLRSRVVQDWDKLIGAMTVDADPVHWLASSGCVSYHDLEASQRVYRTATRTHSIIETSKLEAAAATIGRALECLDRINGQRSSGDAVRQNTLQQDHANVKVFQVPRLFKDVAVFAAMGGALGVGIAAGTGWLLVVPALITCATIAGIAIRTMPRDERT